MGLVKLCPPQSCPCVCTFTGSYRHKSRFYLLSTNTSNACSASLNENYASYLSLNLGMCFCITLPLLIRVVDNSTICGLHIPRLPAFLRVWRYFSKCSTSLTLDGWMSLHSSTTFLARDAVSVLAFRLLRRILRIPVSSVSITVNYRADRPKLHMLTTQGY